MSCQTTSGLMGISMWRTPYGASASTIAATIAGVAPIVPASPTPFAPSGFTGDGVSVLIKLKVRDHHGFGQSVIHQRAGDELAGFVVNNFFKHGLAD